MKKYFIIFNFIGFCVSFNTTKAQINYWSKVNDNASNTMNQVIYDSSGNFFASFYGRPEVLIGSIYNSEMRIDNEIYNNFRFSPTSDYINLYMCYGQIPRVSNYYGYFKYYKGIWQKDTSYRSQVPFTYKIIDEENTQFGIESNEIHKFYDYQLKDSVKLLTTFPEPIQAFFMYNRDTNFLLLSNYSSNKARIVQINSESGTYTELANINAPMTRQKYSILLKDGRFIIPTEREIFYYKNYGKVFIAPLIDSAERSRGVIQCVAKGLKNGEIVVNKGSKFYLSYDDMKTWVNPSAINKGLPKGPFYRFVLWDSLHAIALLYDDCFFKTKMFILSPSTNQWSELFIKDFSASTYYDFFQDENNNFIGLHQNCGWKVKKNNESNWQDIYQPYFPEVFLSGLVSKYLVTEKDDLGINNYNLKNLYSTSNYGQNWDSITSFNNSIKGLFNFGQGNILLITSLVDNQFYWSEDFGKSFKLQSHQSRETFPIENIKLDHNGNIVVVALTFDAIFYISTDKAKSFKIDKRFSNLNCRGFEFTEDGRYFLDIELNGIRGLYSTYDFVNYYNITEKLGRTFSYIFKYIGNGQLVFSTNNYEGTRGVYYSNDNGETLQDITFDLKDIRGNFYYGTPLLFYFDSQKNLYASMVNDGIYKYNTPLSVSKIYSFQNFIEIYPQPSNHTISFTNFEKIIGRNIKIFNFSGQELFNYKLTINSVPIKSLLPGIYAVTIEDKSKIIWSGRFTKQ